jgi:hypothetical protein
VLLDEEELVVLLDEVELLVEVVPLAPPLPPLAVVPPALPVVALEPPAPPVAPEPPVEVPPVEVPPVEVLGPSVMVVVQPRTLTRAIEAREPANRAWCMTAGLRAQGRAFSAPGNAVAGAGLRG